MEALPGLAVSVSGGLIGFAAGYSVRRAKLCSFGAFEDALAGGDTRRLKVFGLALAVAVLATQAMLFTHVLQIEFVRYLPVQVPWLSIITGSVLFGVGMALVGTCAFGSLIRLASGDLRSVLTLLIFATVAYATLRGVLAPVRFAYFETVSFTMPGETQSDGASLISYLAGGEARVAVTLLVSGALISLFALDAGLRRVRRLLFAGIVLGLCIAAGWLVTGGLADQFAPIISPDSLTFVAPVAKSVYALILGHETLLDFGIASVFGVIAGAYAAAARLAEFHWEAFDDHREMKRHMTGACLMGFGGVLAGGCTIGQGLTAGSMLALSMPIAVIGMALGARLGIAFLLEGSVRGLVSRLIAVPWK